MSRDYCPQCNYPQSACICDYVQPISANTELIVLQHPSEVGHAKNSVRLLQLVLPATQVWVGEGDGDFVALRQQLRASNKAIYLLYPSQASISANELAIQRDVILLLLDGTWRKVFRLLQLNPWLLEYPALHLDIEAKSNYRIRKASRSDSLSSLEAAAFILQSIEPQLDISPLLTAFDAMVDKRIAAMPAQVRARYKDAE